MKYSIYYFTGTGNSLFIAERLAIFTGSTAKIIPKVMSHMQNEIFGSHIIIIFPSYLALIYGVPVIVKEFVENIPNISSKKITAICSCGGYEIVNAVPSVRKLEKIIISQGGVLFNYYTLRMPMNNLDYDHIPVPIQKDIGVLIERAEKKIIFIANNLSRCKRFCIKRTLNHTFQLLMIPLYMLLKKISFKSMIEIAKEPKNSQKSIEEIFRLTDRSISVDEKCNRCGICVKVCPVNNIQIEGNYPVWQHNCEMCFACHEWCPQKAVHHWGRKEGVYYHHPQISLQDLIHEKQEKN